MSLQAILLLLTTYKYYLLFPLVVIEGPIITVIAGFLSAMGVMDVYVVYAIVVVGDLTGDTISYLGGRFGGASLVNKYGRYFGIKSESVEKFRFYIRKHAAKTIIGGKLAHTMEMPFLISAGMAKVSYWKFFLYTLIPTLPKSLLFLFIGFYFGASYTKIDGYLNYVSFVVVSLVVIITVVYFVVRRVMAKLNVV